MAVYLDAPAFVKKIIPGNAVILDVRAPKEYNHAHIPGTVSFPLMSDDERAQVGITYKKEGREAAVIKGFELVGNQFADFIKKAKEISPQKEVLIYCWRGGMRSSIMAWVLALGGFKVELLKGGYKSFRKWVLAECEAERKIVVLGGKTGSGKTEMLLELKKAGQQVIDLEAIANHKGSAFGSLGQKPQPRNEQFENLLAVQLASTDPSKTTWFENESHLIGTCVLPSSLFEQMRNSLVVEINLDKETRKKRILAEYGNFEIKLLKEKTNKVAKRLGGLLLKEALKHLDDKNLDAWCNLMLDYYDRTYLHSNLKRDKSKMKQVELENDDMKQHVEKVMYAAGLPNMSFIIK